MAIGARTLDQTTASSVWADPHAPGIDPALRIHLKANKRVFKRHGRVAGIIDDGTVQVFDIAWSVLHQDDVNTITGWYDRGYFEFTTDYSGTPDWFRVHIPPGREFKPTHLAGPYFALSLRLEEV